MNIEEIKKEILLKIMSEKDLTRHYVETLPIDDSLRTFMCSLGPEFAYLYAHWVDKCPYEETRKAACKDFYCAYAYTRYVDKSPHDETRKAVSGDPDHSYQYAFYIDRCPHEETRKAACGDPYYACKYACFVDECSHDDTRKAAYRDPRCREWYVEAFGE